jgi:hypothetical protein
MARFLPIILLISVASCAESANAQWRTDLVRRESFDLHCDAQGLTLTELSRYGNGVISSYGCRAVDSRRWPCCTTEASGCKTGMSNPESS